MKLVLRPGAWTLLGDAARLGEKILFAYAKENSDLCAPHKKDRKFLKKVVDRSGRPRLYSTHVDALLRRRGLRFL